MKENEYKIPVRKGTVPASCGILVPNNISMVRAPEKEKKKEKKNETKTNMRSGRKANCRGNKVVAVCWGDQSYVQRPSGSLLV